MKKDITVQPINLNARFETTSNKKGFFLFLFLSLFLFFSFSLFLFFSFSLFLFFSFSFSFFFYSLSCLSPIRKRLKTKPKMPVVVDISAGDFSSSCVDSLVIYCIYIYGFLYTYCVYYFYC